MSKKLGRPNWDATPIGIFDSNNTTAAGMYTCTTNGWLCVYCKDNTGNGNGWHVKVNSTAVMRSNTTLSDVTDDIAIAPVSKGDKVTWPKYTGGFCLTFGNTSLSRKIIINQKYR